MEICVIKSIVGVCVFNILLCASFSSMQTLCWHMIFDHSLSWENNIGVW
jgi:hypothetical protein